MNRRDFRWESGGGEQARSVRVHHYSRQISAPHGGLLRTRVGVHGILVYILEMKQLGVELGAFSQSIGNRLFMI